jgi:hypothetical protein
MRAMVADTDVVAVRLTARIDGLAEALSRARVPLAERARLLELAALAALEAVTLDASRTEQPAPRLAPVTPLTAAPSLRAAAA